MSLHHELITTDMRTTSRIVAEKFGKRHDNVLRDIAGLKEDAPGEFWLLNFEERDYLDSRGKNQPMVELTRDGFVLLAMGFTGAAAMAWKVRFIEAFNLMEEELKRPRAAAEIGFGDLTLQEAGLWLSSAREVRHLYGVVAARRFWEGSPLPQVKADHENTLSSTEGIGGAQLLETWLTECFEVTGDARDRITFAEMWQSFRDWSEETGAVPMGRRAFSNLLKAVAASWRDRATGRRIGRMKSGIYVYTGLRHRSATDV